MTAHPKTKLLLSTGAKVFLVALIAAMTSVSATAQSDWSPHRETDRSADTIERRVQQNRVRLPAPIRLSQHEQETADHESFDLEPVTMVPMTGHDEFGLTGPNHYTGPSHAVIRSPDNRFQPGTGNQPSAGFHNGPSAGLGQLSSDQEHLPPPPLHGGHTKLAKKKWPLGPVQPTQAKIPGAKQRPVWKQPYSYGYFGASGNRHWGKHHGYRDRYTEYRYR